MIALRFLVFGLFIVGAIAFRADAHSTKNGDDRNPYVAAFAAAEGEKWTKARRLAAAGDSPLLRKVVTWLELTRSRRLPSFDRISAFIEDNPDWPNLRQLRRRAEAVIDAKVGDDRIFAWFASYPPLTGLGRLRLAAAYDRTGDEEAANEMLRGAWIFGDFTYREEKAIFAQYRKRFRTEDHVARLDRLLWDGRRRAAKRMLRRVGADQRALAEARIKLRARAGDVDSAIARVPEELRDDPGLLYERLLWRRRKGRDEAAREILASPPDDLVRPKAWWREARIQIRKTLNEGYISESYRLASEHRQLDSVPRSQAEWLAGWIALRFLEDPALAYSHFVTLFDDVSFPISVARAAYWAGRTTAAEGDSSGAEDWYRRAAQHPATYYGQLALAALGGGGRLPMPEAPEATRSDADFVDKHELTQVIHALADIGQGDHLRPFVLRLQELATTPGQYKLVAAAATAAGRPDLALAAARRSAWKGTFLIEQGYPVVELPPSRGREVEAEPALLLAMLRQESGFNSAAVSSAGARGVMQLLPRTARVMAGRLKIPYSRKRLTSDAIYNLTLGRAHVEELLAAFDGSYVLAMAAYNAGPKRVKRWLREVGDPRKGEIDMIDWIELIPLSETRNYVQRVLEAVPPYRHILGKPSPAHGLAIDLLRGIATTPS